VYEPAQRNRRSQILVFSVKCLSQTVCRFMVTMCHKRDRGSRATKGVHPPLSRAGIVKKSATSILIACWAISSSILPVAVLSMNV